MPRPNAKDRRRQNKIADRLGTAGFALPGTILERSICCKKPGCRCTADPPRLHGPYYQWTRKVGGKTVTVRLSLQEATLLEEWIANGRRLDRLIGQMEGVSLRRTDRLLKKLGRS